MGRTRRSGRTDAPAAAANCTWERVGGRQEVLHTKVCFEPQPSIWHKEILEFVCFELQGLNMDLSSLQKWVFIHCLLVGEWTLLNKTCAEERGKIQDWKKIIKEPEVGAEFSPWLNWNKNILRACSCLLAHGFMLYIVFCRATAQHSEKHKGKNLLLLLFFKSKTFVDVECFECKKKWHSVQS